VSSQETEIIEVYIAAQIKIGTTTAFKPILPVPTVSDENTVKIPP
jgi:hypothetical protein